MARTSDIGAHVDLVFAAGTIEIRAAVAEECVVGLSEIIRQSGAVKTLSSIQAWVGGARPDIGLTRASIIVVVTVTA